MVFVAAMIDVLVVFILLAFSLNRLQLAIKTILFWESTRTYLLGEIRGKRAGNASVIVLLSNRQRLKWSCRCGGDVAGLDR